MLPQGSSCLSVQLSETPGDSSDNAPSGTRTLRIIASNSSRGCSLAAMPPAEATVTRERTMTIVRITVLRSGKYVWRVANCPRLPHFYNHVDY